MAKRNSVTGLCYLVIAVFLASTNDHWLVADEKRSPTQEERLVVLKEEYTALKKKLQTEKRSKALEKYFATQIEKFAKAKKLSPDQIAHLKVASKGAIKHQLKSSEPSAEELPAWAIDFGENYRPCGELVFLGGFSNSNALQQPIWIAATNQFRSPKEIENRKSREEFKFRVLVDVGIVKLDEALKFSPKQRNGLRELVLARFGDELRRYRFGREEEYFFLHPLTDSFSRLSGKELATVLREKQLAKWPVAVESLVY